ncbi:LysR family transcriptional regulator [Limosilactobacillus caecicola]|uniref:LysR family transcriptional regulator n=1 Tax=Limosilactobacillus caecicola TaxID=2941332 RepID=UPI002042438F|nr:LysR family transcriptional regulator [Limosilactobacillus caecicola]
MIDNYLLEYLVAFAQTGTIAGVAEQLSVTQPTVSRGLKKLEALLGVTLFDRQPQKITLNATGQFAAQRAAEILASQQEFQQAIQHFAKQNQLLRVAATFPGPLLLLKQLSGQLNRQLSINTTPLTVDEWPPLLLNHHYGLIFSSQEIQTDAIESRYLGNERLMIKITKYNRLFERSTVNFNDLNGHEFIVAGQTGEWQTIIEREIPHAQFLYQSQSEAMQELIQHSNFPIFKTNITHYLEQQDGRHDRKRKIIPIQDSKAILPIYGSYLKTTRATVKPVLDQLAADLAQIDSAK